MFIGFMFCTLFASVPFLPFLKLDTGKQVLLAAKIKTTELRYLIDTLTGNPFN